MNPVETAQHCHATSTSCCSILVESLVSHSELNYEAHRQCVQMGAFSATISRTEKEKWALTTMKEKVGVVKRHKLTRATKTGAWLTVVPDRLNGMELSEEEFRDNLRLHYGLTPLKVQSHCDGRGKPLTVEH
eukprot:3922803-Ditylum_brightwellii.AAC.1